MWNQSLPSLCVHYYSTLRFKWVRKWYIKNEFRTKNKKKICAQIAEMNILRVDEFYVVRFAIQFFFRSRIDENDGVITIRKRNETVQANCDCSHNWKSNRVLFNATKFQTLINHSIVKLKPIYLMHMHIRRTHFNADSNSIQNCHNLHDLFARINSFSFHFIFVCI